MRLRSAAFLLVVLLGGCSQAGSSPDALPLLDVPQRSERDTGDIELPRPTAADPPGEAAPPSCASTVADPANCGRCGHDCLGGTCAAGVCQAKTVVENSPPLDLVVDASYIYWSTWNDQLVRAHLDGSQVEALTVGTTTNIYAGMGDDGGAVYWLSQGRIERCAKSGCAGQPQVLVGTAFQLAVTASAFFWTAGSGAVHRATVAGGAVTGDAVVYAGSNVQRFAADATELYAAESADDSVRACALPAGCSPYDVAVASGQSQVADIMLDASAAFWTRTSAGKRELVRLPRHAPAGTTPSVLASDVIAATLDGSSVYWCDAYGTVWSCALAGCGAAGPAKVGAGLEYVAAMASSGGALYFARRFLGPSNEVTGAISRLAK